MFWRQFTVQFVSLLKKVPWKNILYLTHGALPLEEERHDLTRKNTFDVKKSHEDDQNCQFYLSMQFYEI